jgi:squalene-hopene/tetraprenyl-beta-curcumene cyclase
MNTTDLVHYLSVDVPHRHAAKRPAPTPSYHQLAAPVRNSILRARQYLQGEQRLDGSWAGRKSGDVSQLSQVVLLLAYLGRERSELAAQAARAIARDQQPEGGWSLAPGGPIDLGASVLAYFALKVAGEDASQQDMSRARQAIRNRGGADAAGMTTRRWLALLGQADYDYCLPIAPEWLLMPTGWMHRAFAGDVSTTNERQLAALAVVWALRPRRDVELARGVRELFVDQPQHWVQVSVRHSEFWRRCERLGFLPLRKRALDRAASLLAGAAIEAEPREVEFEEVAWRWIALRALGFGEDSREMAACESGLQRFVAVDDECDEARSQRQTSLTADTALAIEALHVSGVSHQQPAVAAGLHWLVDHRLRPDRGWDNAREMAAVLRALAVFRDGDERAAAALPPGIQLAENRWTRLARRACRKIIPHALLCSFSERLSTEFLVRQQPDGGWSPWVGADPNWRSGGVLHAIDRRPPLASAPDVTGAMLEVLSLQGISPRHRAVRRAAAYLRAAQRGDGSWDSATGARFIHGTAWAVRGLVAAGAAANDPAVAAGVNWLLVHQQESGGWGETVVHTALERDYVAADATAIQSAWAVLALVAAGQADHDATRRGIQYLLDMQQDNGRWSDSPFTVRDSAAGSWHRNDLHSAAVPLIALARWVVAIGTNREEKPLALRLVTDESLA